MLGVMETSVVETVLSLKSPLQKYSRPKMAFQQFLRAK